MKNCGRHTYDTSTTPITHFFKSVIFYYREEFVWKVNYWEQFVSGRTERWTTAEQGMRFYHSLKAFTAKPNEQNATPTFLNCHSCYKGRLLSKKMKFRGFLKEDPRSDRDENNRRWLIFFTLRSRRQKNARKFFKKHVGARSRKDLGIRFSQAICRTGFSKTGRLGRWEGGHCPGVTPAERGD